MKTRFEFSWVDDVPNDTRPPAERLVPATVEVLEWRLIAGSEFLTPATLQEHYYDPDEYADAIKGVCAVTCGGVTVRVEAAIYTHGEQADAFEDLAREASECANRNRHLFAGAA